ncbi:LacI family DNA-binding transcriptional regulator [Lentilactobacillus hilgardii]|uniref:LacI family DNA-binding transcriptional regulator n=1 Tax=Lentilactobacillus hilgardii TaxID=1588 RepID=UPI00390CA4F1
MTNNGRKSANIKDVAALAGVSVATISRYLNGELDRMSKKTAENVRNAIEKLNYVPNSVARQMKTRSSKMIAVIVSNVDDYFSTELFKGISSILESSGYIGVLFDADSDDDREQRLLKTIGSQLFDGVIMQPANNPQTITEALRRSMPIVTVDREIDDSPWPQVVINNYEVARSVSHHFVQEGYSRVVVLTSEIKKARTRQERYRGITAEFKHVDVLEISEVVHNHQTTYQQLLHLIQKNDEKTVIFSLKERWFLEFVPQLVFDRVIDNKRVTATGFADTDYARRLEPRLKLISQNPYFMGASSAEVMLNQLQDKSQKAKRIVIRAKFE